MRDQGVWPPVVLLGFGFVLLAFLPVYIAIVVVALIYLMDGVILAHSPRLTAEDVRLTLSVRPEGDLEATFAGATAIARLTLSKVTPGAVRRVQLTLLVPPGVEILGDWHRQFSAVPGVPSEKTYRLRLNRVGTAVFPGVLLTRRGPLGIVHRSVLLFSRSRLAVLPDYERSLHPVVARYLKPGSRPGEKVRGRAIKGGGTEFAEIRDYVPGDSLRRMDWKATARRAKMLVREYEEPREFTVRMVMDASADLVSNEGYTRVAGLVSKLGYIASRESMGLTVTAYDENVVFDRNLRGNRSAFRRLLAELVELPRRTLTRTAGSRLSDQGLFELLGKEINSVTSDWRPGSLKTSPEAALELLFGGRKPDREMVLEALADLSPVALAAVDARCPECQVPRFPDEGACASCGQLLFDGGLPPRTLCLASVLESMTRTARGREMWVLVSSFTGGEACREVAERLIYAVTPYRRVHVVLPTIHDLTNDAIEWPQSLGMYPTREGTQRDVEALYTSERFRDFVRSIRAAGVKTHALEREQELEEVVARVLLSEVIG